MICAVTGLSHLANNSSPMSMRRSPKLVALVIIQRDRRMYRFRAD